MLEQEQLPKTRNSVAKLQADADQAISHETAIADEIDRPRISDSAFEDRLKTISRSIAGESHSLRLDQWIILAALAALVSATLAGPVTGIIMTLVIISLGLFGNKRTQRAINVRDDAVNELLELHDGRAVGALTEAFMLDDKEIQTRAAYGLIEVLPRLTSNDTAFISSKHWQNLNGVLDHYPYTSADKVGMNTKLKLAIVDAYAQVGGQAALRVVRTIATGAIAAESVVRRAAAEALPIIEHRLQERDDSIQLLRGAANDEAPARSLVRPVGQRPNEPDDELLRPDSALGAEAQSTPGSEASLSNRDNVAKRGA